MQSSKYLSAFKIGHRKPNPDRATDNKLQEIINQRAWPASWPLNVRQAAKIKIFTVRV